MTETLVYQRPGFLPRLIRRMELRSMPVGRCLEWQGPRVRGYGRTQAWDRPMPAHRVAWILAHGPVPEGMFVLHHCDNPPCIKTEPDELYPEGHLFLGTSKDNTADMIHKGRAAPRTLYGNAKLSREQRDFIRTTQRGRGTLALARRFGVTPGTIRVVRNGRTWNIDRKYNLETPE